MEKALLTVESEAQCTSFNYSGQRLAIASADGAISIFDSVDPTAPSSSLHFSSRWTAHEGRGIIRLVWVPPEYGDALACVCDDGTFSLWEETNNKEDSKSAWELCKLFESDAAQVLDLQFGVYLTSLRLVAAYSDGHVKVYELLDPLELKSWHLQADFQNIIDSVSRIGKPGCLSASIAWNQRGANQQSSFILGYNSDLPQINSTKVWEFDEAHNRWIPIAELAMPGDKGDRVHCVAWAPNIGRPYEVLAIATCKGISIWHLDLNSNPDGRVLAEKVALLSGHDGEVWQLEWDMSGMTLASTGSDGMVRLWQSNLNGIWHEKATFESC